MYQIDVSNVFQINTNIPFMTSYSKMSLSM